MLRICGFHRNFSEIAPFQKAHNLFYEAEQRDVDGEICFRVSCSGEKDMKEELWASGIGVEAARHIVKYLWENAVPAETWKEIVADVLTQIKETGKGCEHDKCDYTGAHAEPAEKFENPS